VTEIESTYVGEVIKILRAVHCYSEKEMSYMTN